MKINKKDRKKIAIGIWILLGLLALGVLYILVTKMQNKNEPITDENYFSDNNCTCTERNRDYCMDGFELKDNLCFNETLKLYTNVVKGCSKYRCETATYRFNKYTKDWR